jgi:hypothetical protein
MSEPPMMPTIAPPKDFARIPNELVLNIAKHLGNARDSASTQALNRLGSLNHDYHEYSEEFLYEHCDTISLPSTPFHLLRTLLERPDLAARVKSMAISLLQVSVSDGQRVWRRKEVGFVPWTKPLTLTQFLKKLRPRVLSLIKESQLLPTAKKRWIVSLKAYHPAVWYGALLALTSDLAELNLDVWHRGHMFPDMLSLAPLVTLANEHNSPILRKLETMNVTFTPVDRLQHPIGYDHPEGETITLVTELPGIWRVKNLTITVEPTRMRNQYFSTEARWQAGRIYTWGHRNSSKPIALEKLTFNGWCPPADLGMILAHCHSLRSFTWRIFPRIHPDSHGARIGSLGSYVNGILLDDIWGALRWVAGTLEKLTLHVEGTATNHLKVQILDLRNFTKLKHLELVGGFELKLFTPVSYFILPNLESLAISVSSASRELILGDESGKTSAVKDLRQCLEDSRVSAPFLQRVVLGKETLTEENFESVKLRLGTDGIEVEFMEMIEKNFMSPGISS